MQIDLKFTQCKQTFFSHDCAMELDFARNKWSVPLTGSRGWPSVPMKDFSREGDFEVRSNGVIWIWDQMPGQPKRNTFIIRDAPSSEYDRSHVSGNVRILDSPNAELKNVEFPWERLIPHLDQALRLINEFASRPGGGVFPTLSRQKVAVGLTERVTNPKQVNQESSGLCGPAAFIYSLADDHPAEYARFVIDLYEKGEAKLRTNGELIKPRATFFKSPPSSQPADWIAMGSLRDASNTFEHTPGGMMFNYTVPGEFTDWLKKAGYTGIVDYANRLVNAKPLAWHPSGIVVDMTEIYRLNSYYDQGYRVWMLIDSDMLTGGDGSLWSNHWIVMTSRIHDYGNGVSFSAYSWGGNVLVPTFGRGGNQSRMALSRFLKLFYGFVAARP